MNRNVWRMARVVLMAASLGLPLAADANPNGPKRHTGGGAAPGPQTAGAAGAAKPSAAPKPAGAGQGARDMARKATVAAGAAGAATAAALALADDDQRHAYTLTHLGEYQCEFKRAVRVLAHPRHEGYVDLHFDRRVVTARPVLSSTGAIRLEDVAGRYLMVQIAFKSMLLDSRSGQRVADDCVHDNHLEARRAAADAPPTPGLGIGATAPQPPGAATAPNPAR